MRVFTLFATVAAISALPCLPATAQQQQDPRVQQLEIEVARLNRELGTLSRRVAQLERNAQPAETATPPTATRPSPANNRNAPWTTLANWDRVKPGMTSTQVIEILGPPNTVRDAKDGTRTLLYATEMGPNAILAGNVRMNAQGVTEVTKPTLR